MERRKVGTRLPTPTNSNNKDYELILEYTDYWNGQMIYITEAERQDGDYHYNNWDLEPPERLE